ncbi:hypothetical protein ACKGJI_04605 [Sulfurospirillum sp. 1307]
MKKIIILLFLSLNLLKADYLLLNLERCAKDYYYSYDSSVSKYKLYYLNSYTNRWNSTTSNVGAIVPGYISLTDENGNYSCVPNPTSNELGLNYSDYMFLLSLCGLLLGFSWLFGFTYIMSRGK